MNFNKEDYYKTLKECYENAPINKFYQPTATIADGIAEIRMPLKEDFYHYGNYQHGSVYFKMCDDAGYFAAQSQEFEKFIVTASYNIYFLKPIKLGQMVAKGSILNKTKTQFICETVIFNDNKDIIARGSGVFVRSSRPLEQI